MAVMDNATIDSGIQVSESTNVFIFLGHIIGFSPIISTSNSEAVLSERKEAKNSNYFQCPVYF